MNDEIREILDKLKDDNWYDELDLTGDKWIELKQTETNKILDYITNLQQENERLKERVAYLERSNNRREDTILGLRQEINDVEDCNDELKKKLDKTLEVLQYELQFQTGGCYHRLSNLFDYLQNGSDSQ